MDRSLVFVQGLGIAGAILREKEPRTNIHTQKGGGPRASETHHLHQRDRRESNPRSQLGKLMSYH